MNKSQQHERDLIFLHEMLAKLDWGHYASVREMICDWIDDLGGNAPILPENE